tara:strand:- start:36 stop:542 length:507 start_codon:yes stop_codon:yes gene_type:complete
MGITGKQIRNDTVTGDDVNESTLVLPQVYHSSADYNNNNNAIVYISMPGRNNWTTGFTTRQHQMIAPYDGKVVKFMLRPTTGDGSNNVTVQLRTNPAGNTVENDPGNTDLSMAEFQFLCANNHATVTFTPSTPPSITKGHAFGFALKKSGTQYGHTNFVAVIEWDLGS